MRIGAVLVDFDGTACLHDAAEHVLEAFADGAWPELDEAWARGEIDGARAISDQAAMLHEPLERLISFAVEHCPVDPTFGPFAAWLEGLGVPVTIVSDGFGFYVEPILRSAGLAHLPVLTNTWASRRDGRASLEHPNANPPCVGCGTCKMNAVTRARERHGPVAFVGEGRSDRYGALYADVAFAKDELVPICEADAVPYLPWSSFDDVRAALEALPGPPGPVAPLRCPGWRTE